jgi:hypothetical protein
MGGISAEIIVVGIFWGREICPRGMGTIILHGLAPVPGWKDAHDFIEMKNNIDGRK